MNNRILVIDVESIGLHGPAFAVGCVLIDFDGKTIDEKMWAVDPESFPSPDPMGIKWVRENVWIAEVTHKYAYDMRNTFWKYWMSVKTDCIMAADVNWPVEANFLSECVGWDRLVRCWDGPYPLLDIASFRLGAGEHGMKTMSRLENELPAHNPLCDARQSARLLIECMNRNKAIGLVDALREMQA